MLIRYNGRDTFALPGDYESPIEQLPEFAKHASRMRRVPAELLGSNGLRVVHREILNKNCSKSWDLGLDILKNKALWQIAVEYGSEVVDFLRAFRAMRAGFASGNFIYGLIVAKRV